MSVSVGRPGCSGNGPPVGTFVGDVGIDGFDALDDLPDMSVSVGRPGCSGNGPPVGTFVDGEGPTRRTMRPAENTNMKRPAPQATHIQVCAFLEPSIASEVSRLCTGATLPALGGGLVIARPQYSQNLALSSVSDPQFSQYTGSASEIQDNWRGLVLHRSAMTLVIASIGGGIVGPGIDVVASTETMTIQSQPAGLPSIRGG